MRDTFTWVINCARENKGSGWFLKNVKSIKDE